MKTAYPVIISTTLPTAAKASALARAVVGARLAACAHLIPLRSIYWWQGKVEHDAEVAIQFKTRRPLARHLMSFIRERHPYEVPEIVVTPILDGWPDYLAWINRETTSASLTSRPARPRKSLSGKRRAP